MENSSPNSSNNKTAPALDDVMLAMDVVDTLRHQQNLVDRELQGDQREAQLISKLRKIYSQQGIEVSDQILHEGVAALDESRFVYTLPSSGMGVNLAKLYVSRALWGKWFLGIFGALILSLLTYNLIYIPLKNAQVEASRVELSEEIPNKLDSLYQAVFDETKIQTAPELANDIRTRGKIAAQENDRTRALQAVSDLQTLVDTIRLDYTLRVVSRDGVQSGFWTFPEANSVASNYYIVVEALDNSTKQAISLPILNEENNETEVVSLWGLRVSEDIYRAVAADKRDDGIIQRNIVGLKQYGYVDTEYVVPVLGGAVTRW